MDDLRFDPPDTLSDRAKSIWRDLVPSQLRSLGAITLLQSALEALDVCDRATAELSAVSTLMAKTLATGTVHQHPAYKTAKEARAQFAALWGQLKLDVGAEDRQQFSYWLSQQAKREEHHEA